MKSQKWFNIIGISIIALCEIFSIIGLIVNDHMSLAYVSKETDGSANVIFATIGFPLFCLVAVYIWDRYLGKFYGLYKLQCVERKRTTIFFEEQMLIIAVIGMRILYYGFALIWGIDYKYIISDAIILLTFMLMMVITNLFNKPNVVGINSSVIYMSIFFTGSFVVFLFTAGNVLYDFAISLTILIVLVLFYGLSMVIRYRTIVTKYRYKGK